MGFGYFGMRYGLISGDCECDGTKAGLSLAIITDPNIDESVFVETCCLQCGCGDVKLIRKEKAQFLFMQILHRGERGKNHFSSPDEFSIT